MSSWLTTYNLPPSTYHLKPTTYSLPPHNGAAAGISATRIVSQLFASLSNVRYVKIVNIITAVFLYDLFGHYSYDDFGVLRAPLSIRLTLGGHYRTSAFKRSARWQASQHSPLWTFTLT